MDEFVDDMEETVGRMKEALGPDLYTKMTRLKDMLLKLHAKNLVKINHSIMELICAKHLIEGGFEVEIEHTLNGVSCDIYAVKGYGSLIVEVETGFVPPEHALDPKGYLSARVASKITRYSGFANKFCLGTPPYYVMQVPQALTKPPRFRTGDEIASIKRLCDVYYTNPPVTIEEIRNARLHSIYVMDIDSLAVREWDLNEYMGKAALWSV